jgi:tetratricopeptide (TPR) repeat protein
VNIWSWVEDLQRELAENGQGRLAELIDRLPSAVLEDQNAEVEAIVPEALALARALELPWVEIFIRHWHMQAVAGGFETLPQAVELLEFSHREEHVSCPQSVCTVQDVAIAYAGADGPGYAEERLAVAEEALGRIDPSWPCFTCIAGEKVDALDDAGRHEDAIAFAAEARGQIAAAGRKDAEHQISVADSLLALGRAEEALDRLPKPGEEREDTFGRWDRLRRARVLLELGRDEEARDALLSAEEAFSDPKYHFPWARVAARVHDNDWHLGALLERMLVAQVEAGRAWDGTQLAALHAQLALDRGAPNTARHALETLREIAARLRDPERAAERITTLEAALAEDEGEDADPERDVERLLAARRRWPDVLDIAGQLYMALRALGRPGEGLLALRDYVEAHPDDSDALLGYGRALIELGAADEVEAVAERAEPLHGEWLRAQAAYDQGDLAAAREHAERIVEADAEARNARRLLAMACEDLGDFSTALEHRNAILAAVPDDESEHDHWCRLIPATATGDWAAVRESGARLGMEFDSDEGPVDEAWAYVRLRFDARDIVLGLRTGPVSARVLTVSAAGAPQHAGDLVVFEPSPIGETEEGQAHLFGVVTVLEEGPRRGFPFDGVYPGDEVWEAFVGELREQGWLIDPRSTREYTFEVDGEQRPAIFGYLAVPDDLELTAAHERLGELTAGWRQPFTWLPLAEAAGDERAAAEQRAHAETFALY